MKSILRALVGSIVFWLSSCSIYHSEEFRDYEDGVEAATRELVTSRISMMDNIGIIRNGTIEMRRSLKKKYGIEHVYDTSRSLDFVRGYNLVMRAAAKEKFGERYYEDALAEIRPLEDNVFEAFLNNPERKANTGFIDTE